MTTLTEQKINLNNCTHEALFKAITRIEAKIAKTSVKDKDRVAHSIRHVAALAEHYVPSDADNVSTTRLGNPQFKDWLPSEFGANRSYWEKKAVTGGKLLIGTYTCPHTGQQLGVFQTMSGTPVDILSPSFQTIYQNFICYPPSLHMETQSKINDIIGEEIVQELRTGRQQVGMFYAIEFLQHCKIVLQNKLSIRRAEISRQLIQCISTPVRSHKQAMVYRERLELLIGMKERANGLPFRSCDEEVAHMVVNAQTENEKVPFSTEQSRIDMARILGEFNRDIELGNDIDLDHLLTKIANVFPPESAPDEPVSLQVALHAAVSQGSNFQRKAEQNERQPGQDNDKNYKGKRKQDARESQSEDKWERVFRYMNDFKSDIGGLRKSVNENATKIELLAQGKPINSGKENVPEQSSKDQKQGKFAGLAAKGKGKQLKVAPPYKATVQELRSDSEPDEEISAYIASVKKVPVKRFDDRAMHAHNCNDTQEGIWSYAQPTLGASMRTSAFASMCLADDVLGGDQQVSGCPASSSQVTMTSNPLSLFSKLAAFSVQQPGCGYTDALISALRNKEGDKLTEAKKDDPSCVLSSELPYVIREVSDNEIQPESTPQARPVTRRESRISSYTWPTVLEPPSDDESALDKSLVEYAIDKPPAGQGVPVSTSRRSFSKTADHLPMRTSTSGSGAIVRTKPQWDVTEDNEIPDLPRSTRSTPKTADTPRLRSGGPVSN